MKVLVTGACGYKGSVLVPKLLEAGYSVRAIDVMWFGNFLPNHINLEILNLDVRDYINVPLDDIEAIIHLSSVANDPCSDLEPLLTWEISCLATMKLVDRAYRLGIKHFIYASSGSVYGVSEEERVTEDLEAMPISEYNKTKMVSERVLLSYANDMTIQIVRPATVCGLSPRMRLDVAVNMLTMQALVNGKITVLGGQQKRPNIHIDDITDVYMFMLRNPQLSGIFNAGFENMSIRDLADLIATQTGAIIEYCESNDPRSYRLDSKKLLGLGFVPKKNVFDAITEISAAFKSGKLKNEDHFYNLKWMKTLDLSKKLN